MDALFRTGYPHPINLFAALMLSLLPLLSPLAADFGGEGRAPIDHVLAGGLSFAYLLTWSRLRVSNPERSPRFYQVYLLIQTGVVALIYTLDGGLTRFLFVVVAVQAVYLSPVRRWAPFLGTVAALWLTLYLVISPGAPGALKVSTIGMYLCYLIFAALVSFTLVQQERQGKVARALLEDVDQRHQALRAYDLTVEHRSEMEERERLAQTIHARLVSQLSGLMEHLEQLTGGRVPLTRETARAARLEAKEVLSAIRSAVRTLRPGEEAALGEDQDESGAFGEPPEPEVAMKRTDPIRVYHIWNIGVIVVTTGVIIASSLVAGTARWAPLLGLGLALLTAYTGAALARQPWSRTLAVVLQAGLIVWIIWLSEEPLMSHLFLIIAAQMVFLVPLVLPWLVAAVAFPTVLTGVALWFTRLFDGEMAYLIALLAAFCVTYFFGAVMAFMTRRQVEAREKAVTYAQQLAEVNRLLEARLQELRQMAIARERVRMAREIHDGLGHHLTIVIMELQYAEQLADEEPQNALQHIADAQSVIRSATEASQGMVQTLERFDRPLAEALSELVGAWQNGNGATVSLRINGDFTALSTAARMTVYRTVQESLTNIQKHANPNHVEIVLIQLPDRVILTVTNDQRGDGHLGGAPPGGFGLVGLRERADALQGEFAAGPLRGGGFFVKLVLPMGV